MSEDMASELDDLWHEASNHCEHPRDFDKAIEIFKYILIRYGDNSSAAEQAHAHLADILLMLGRFGEGESHIRKALSYDPENPDYHHLLGFVYYMRQEWDNAVKEYKLALDREPWNRGYLRSLGAATFNAGDKKTGLQYLHEVAPLYPNNSGMLNELATAYMSIGDMTSAKEYAEEAVRTNPADVMAHAVLRRIKQETGGLPR
jgi:tetratricopeptide (TPR) repeat protein